MPTHRCLGAWTQGGSEWWSCTRRCLQKEAIKVSTWQHPWSCLATRCFVKSWFHFTPMSLCVSATCVTFRNEACALMKEVCDRKEWFMSHIANKVPLGVSISRHLSILVSISRHPKPYTLLEWCLWCFDHVDYVHDDMAWITSCVSCARQTHDVYHVQDVHEMPCITACVWYAMHYIMSIIHHLKLSIIFIT